MTDMDENPNVDYKTIESLLFGVVSVSLREGFQLGQSPGRYRADNDAINAQTAELLTFIRGEIATALVEKEAEA